MTKSELTNGSVVELRGGEKLIKIDDALISIEDSTGYGYNLSLDLDDYDDELNYKRSDFLDFDIMKVHINEEYYCNPSDVMCAVFYDNEWTWERTGLFLTSNEKDMLQTICNHYPVKHIIKREHAGDLNYQEDVCVVVDSDICEDGFDIINLPYFEAGTKFKALELEKKYTPTEIGLKDAIRIFKEMIK